VHLGLRHDRGASRGLDPLPRAELLHAVASHHDRQAARTAEAAVLYHANQLDAQAATRPRRAKRLICRSRSVARRFLKAALRGSAHAAHR
jgi:hypothetical protein